MGATSQSTENPNKIIDTLLTEMIRMHPAESRTIHVLAFVAIEICIDKK